MKTNFKRIGKQSISIVLAVMMMLSTMLVGMVTSNAANNAHFYVVGAPVNSNNWDQKSDIIDGNYGSDGVYYIDIALTNDCYFALHNGRDRYSPNTDGEDIGLNTIKTSNNYNKNNAWHYTGDTGTKRIVVDQSANEWYPTVRIENIPSATTHKVTANFRNATVKLGDKTLTSGTAETVDNDKSYTLTVTANSDYSLSKVMQGSTDLGTKGTYTLAAGTDDVTIDITTENNTFDPSNTVYLRMDTADWSSPYGVHIWKNGGQPLTNWDKYPKMTYITTDEDGNDIYGYTPEDGNNLSDYDSIIFRAGDKGDKKTEEIIGVALAGKIYSAKDRTWSTYGSTVPTTKYNVTVVPNIKNGTVTTSATSPLAAGETFTVEATPNADYELVAITVTTADGKPVAATNESTHTYTMPASNVTVSATFKEATKYSVAYTAPTGEGVVSASIQPNDQSLAQGTPVTVTVTVRDAYKASLAVEGVNVNTSKSGNAYTFKFTMPANAITVAPKVEKIPEGTGTKISDLYLIYSDSNNNDPRKFTNSLDLYYDSDNQVYADFSNVDSTKQYYFMISNSKGTETSWENAYYNYNNSVAKSDSKYLECGQAGYNLKTTDGKDAQVKFATFRVRGEYADTVSGVKVNLGYYKDGKIVESSTDSASATTYEITPVVDSSRVKVYAKDGTIRANYQKYADMADTTFTGDDVTNKKSATYYEEGKAKLGSTITVTTTIKEAYRGTYYVKAFCVNGYSYGIINKSDAHTDTGVYTFNYTVPEDCTDDIEITPIYYYIDDTDTVTFYVEDFDETVQKAWGNTIAVQAWYNGGIDEAKGDEGKFDSPKKNALGGYPGQPLVYEGGKYSMQIPKHLKGVEKGVEANTVQGITLNNYIWDDIHGRNKDKINDNAQTYDYDDFYKLSETPDVDNIIFDFRYRTKTDNVPGQDLRSSIFEKEELEPLKDYYGNIVDIFGNNLSKDWTDDCESKYLTVISDGYKKIKDEDNSEYDIGDYATEWSVYDHAGKYITAINCSSLINESKVHPNYQEAYNKLKQYAGIPVKIAYEKSFSDPSATQKGNRADGRWYFSKKAHIISANVQIEYRTDDNSFVKDDFVIDSNVGKKTGAQAYFTNDGYNGQTTCEGAVGEGNFSVQAQTDKEAKYYFIGWYLKTSDGYSFITNKPDANFPMTNNDTYVARFITTPSGTLTLSHTLLDGSAQGKTYISAKIVNPADGTVIYTIPETSDNLVIPSKYVTYASTYSIVATLRTVPYGNDTVEGFYEGYSSDEPNRYNETFTGTGEKTHSVTRDINSLFEVVTDTQGNVISYSLKKSNIPFYSNIESKPQEYTITYNYHTRLDGDKSYVIKDKVSGIELEEMWKANAAAGLENKEQLSKAFIIKKAPFVSNFREKITWNMDKATIIGYNATVLATTEPVKLNISALTVAGSWTAPAPVEYGELAKSNGDYLYKTGTNDFPEKFNYSGSTNYDFSFWAIFNNKAEAEKYSKAVAKYMSGTPDQNMSQRLNDLTKLEGYDNLISKSYSKKYNYVSYQDYYIVPVYADRFANNEIKESQASIRLLEYTRNQWTDDNYGVNGNGIKNEGGSKFDYLYTDFALSFDKDQLLIKDNADIKVGVTFEVVARYDDVKSLDSYVIGSDEAAIRKLVKDATESSKDNGKVGTYEMVDKSRSVYKYEINNSKISDKNRIEYYLRFNNTKNAQQNVMKVYSYIYDKQSGEVFLSAPEYMNMYDIGNLTYITSNLANINLGSDATV